MTAGRVIEISGAVKTYGDGETAVHALRGIDLVVEGGDYVAIMGASGSGKSTLMNVIGCLDILTSGVYRLDGIDVRGLAESQLSLVRNRRIGFIFQAFNLIARTTALANVELPLAYAGIKGAERRRRALAALDLVGLSDRVHHEPNELSGGQQQRVAVARALASQPTIIFADEPTGNLDSRTGAEILSFMRLAVNELGQTIVMVTHDPVAASYADRVIFLADGRIVDEMQDPTADRVLDRMKRFGE